MSNWLVLLFKSGLDYRVAFFFEVSVSQGVDAWAGERRRNAPVPGLLDRLDQVVLAFYSDCGGKPPKWFLFSFLSFFSYL